MPDFEACGKCLQHVMHAGQSDSRGFTNPYHCKPLDNGNEKLAGFCKFYQQKYLHLLVASACKTSLGKVVGFAYFVK